MKYLLLILLFLSTSALKAQDASGINPEDSSPIKGMAMKDFEAFRDGKPMNFTRVAELHHYPAPATVLRFTRELKLSQNQVIQVKDINAYLQRKVLEMGRIILEEEKKLDDLFISGKVESGSLIYRTQQYGLYQGELRNAHLQAHLKTRAVLTKDQVKKYDHLCGYN
jgi:hypothetical protein